MSTGTAPGLAIAYDARFVFTTVVSARTIDGLAPSWPGATTLDGAGALARGALVSASLAAVVSARMIAVLSAAGRLGDGNNMGVTTMTIAVSSSATRVRRSIRVCYGTGSYPPGRKGWQRRIRRALSQAPRIAPWRSSASIAYAEQLG